MKKTIGGDRLGAGKKMTVELKNYERSTHDMSYIWRSTMASGTLVPFMSELGLPGDTFDINLNCEMLTHPTVGPLFGSYKVQLDVFTCPIRLYQGQLHNNKLGIGMNMAAIKLPQIEVTADAIDRNKPEGIDNQQINPSSILSYLNIRGLGYKSSDFDEVKRKFNAIPYLAYWDIYKNYYANKQEEKGAVIHYQSGNQTVISINLTDGILYPDPIEIPRYPATTGATIITLDATTKMIVDVTTPYPDPSEIIINTTLGYRSINQVFQIVDIMVGAFGCENVYPQYIGEEIFNWDYASEHTDTESPQVRFFDLENIDKMREQILGNASSGATVIINKESLEPYNLPLVKVGEKRAILQTQEGLAIKTYQSDLFNNWMSTEWIDGDNGINAITAVDTSEGSFQIDVLQVAKKVYDMLNRIAISGGSYDDWLDAVYSHDRAKMTESPVYVGGLSKELIFQEVVSNAVGVSGEDGEQPLGTLAGKGRMSGKHKGGKVSVRVNEPSYIIGIVSLTPRVDYSQGNKWDMNLKTMDDLHKPALDEIGFQDLIVDQMAYWSTELDEEGNPTYKSAGKQPAWINYMTNVNQVRGNFAIDGNEMFMTLNRRYEHTSEQGIVKDLTTYIDPMKYNNIFAQTSRDAQNFWAQIAVDITARRKMSAKIMPNL